MNTLTETMAAIIDNTLSKGKKTALSNMRRGDKARGYKCDESIIDDLANDMNTLYDLFKAERNIIR